MLAKMLPIMLFTLLLTACSSSSHVLVGQVRPSISPEEVQIYSEKPAHFDEIALVDASSRYATAFSDQGEMDAALKNLKAEAAKLGANGVVISSVSDKQVVQGVDYDDFNTIDYKAIKGIAIYVHHGADKSQVH